MGLNSEVGGCGAHVVAGGRLLDTVGGERNLLDTVVTRTVGRTLQPAREDDGRERECGSFFLDPYTC